MWRILGGGGGGYIFMTVLREIRTLTNPHAKVHKR